MGQWEPHMVGTLRISNPKTLEKWIHSGKFQKELDEGYIFNPDCFRFKLEKCTCYKCRKPNGTLKGNILREVIKRHYDNK